MTASTSCSFFFFQLGGGGGGGGGRAFEEESGVKGMPQLLKEITSLFIAPDGN